MVENVARAVAVVGVGAVLPDAPNADAYWSNLTSGRYSISEVSKDRWDPALYYDADPKAPDKTYSTIGGWVREVEWAPLEWRLPIPPKVSDAMDRTQKWAIVACREALLDYGHPSRPLDGDRMAVILGNAMAGDMHYLTSLRAYFPEYAEELGAAPSFAALDAEVKRAVLAEMHGGIRNRFPHITEDTMPGELGNIIAGRIANLYDFHGPNFVVDAACASALAAIDAAVEGLEHGDYDAVLTGGVDANMGVPSFIKFCKIGALSATGTRPYHDGADGFVMGEGAAVFLLKRLADAERDGDRVYAVIRGIGGSSDGRGKGITAPNPIGQEFAVGRAWKNAALSPNSATYIEGHGTSTRVGDVVEVEALSRVFAGLGLQPGSLALGSVKSNIGHLKSSAGAAGMLKAVKSLDAKALAPSLGGTEPNPNIDFSRSPLYINKELQEWKTEPGQVRTAGVSAFGFGGTNFHIVLEEYVPGRLRVDERPARLSTVTSRSEEHPVDLKAPLRGALVIGDENDAAVLGRLRSVRNEAASGAVPPVTTPTDTDLRAPVRLAIDYGDDAELVDKADKAIKAFEAGNPQSWRRLANRGVFLRRGSPGMTAFLYTGQGSQYVNMLETMCRTEPIVGDLFAEADEVMTPMLGRPLTDYIFADPDDAEAMRDAEKELRQTEITQPAVLTVDIALTRLMAAYGIFPDMVMGHSLGEYAALVAAGAMPFADALHAVAGRGREMANVSVGDNGLMAAVFAPLDTVERTLADIDGYVVIANINSMKQAVIGGAGAAVTEAMERLSAGGAQVVALPVSHAFHTDIVAPAAKPLGRILERLRLESPAIPVVANVDGEFYPMGPNVVPRMIEILERQISSPVQFVKGLRTLYDAGCRTFVEMGPKRALQGMAMEVFGDEPSVFTLAANHPRLGDVASFNRALCGMYAAGHGVGSIAGRPPSTAIPAAAAPARTAPAPGLEVAPPPAPSAAATAAIFPGAPPEADVYTKLGHLFADFLAKGQEIFAGQGSAPKLAAAAPETPVVVTGAGLGLPGGTNVFGDDKIAAILHGEQFIDAIPVRFRQKMAGKHITRLVKSEAGGGHFETIDSQADVIKLAGRGAAVDLAGDFGFPDDRTDSLDRTTELAIGAGIEALRDAGIPLLMHYKTTTTGSRLPERWLLPEAYRDTTGVIFASAFPGADAIVGEVDRYWEAESRRLRMEELRSLQERTEAGSALADELRHRLHALQIEEERNPYAFDRRFLFRAVSMGHAQFAEYIGARGPNTQINAACASTTQAISLAEDWINAGRCDRVVVISGDDVTSDRLLEWIGSGFLAVGAAATDEVVEEAALPFDRRRHGMILGMGAAAIVVERADSAASRGIRPIAEVLSAVTANSAFHGSRLDASHITQVMEDLIATAERRWGIDRHEIAAHAVFISHETYTPARGGSAQAEVDALRYVFGADADRIVISNTKGFTGHAMGVGIEDVVAVKSIETGIVPPVPNFQEIDPDLGDLNLSRGGTYPVTYALRLGAGFGSQISLTLYRAVPSPLGRHPGTDELGYAYRIVDTAAWRRWLTDVSGLADAHAEVARRTLRIRDDGVPGRPPVAPAAARAEAAPPPAPAPAPVTPEPTATPPTAPAPTVTGQDPVAARVLEIVATQTGYPTDMLDLDLDLEADLGIDTVKQAETFAAIRDEYGIERDDSLALRDYPTLNAVIGFVHERRPDLTHTPPPTTPAPAVTAPVTGVTPGPAALEGDDDAAAAVPRRIPTAVLRPALELCAPTGVTIGAGSRIVVMLDHGGVGRAMIARLETRGATVLAIDGRPTSEELTARLDHFAAAGPIQGVYWLPALDVEEPVAAMDLGAWREALRLRVKLLYATMRHLYESVGGPGTFLVTATRLGGRHGYDEAGATAPLGGAVTGFTKAYKREKPEALVKAIDFAPSRKTASLADVLLAETERDPGAVEIGCHAGERWTIGLREEALPEEPGGIVLGPETVVLVTGAAGSIVSAITADLARASGGTFHLLDLVPEPDRDDAEIAAFAADREGLKRRIFERLRAAGERATPAMVDGELARLERAQAALAAIRAIEAAGGTVHYHSVDLLDGDAVAGAVGYALATSGRIDLLLHAGGLEISHRLPDKTAREYDLVFDVKADGWFNLLKAMRDAPLGASVVFSSVAGRFGNNGQTDYSAANDLLCKMTSSLRSARPDTLGVALDWTAWDDIGMATRGSIPAVMKAVGIDMLPARSAIPIVRREVTGRAVTGEQVVGLRLGVLLEEFHPTGGLDVSPGGPVANLVGAGAVEVHGVTGFGIQDGLTVTAALDPAEQPFLFDHRIDGTPVLPGVMGIEAFAETAKVLFPDRAVAAVEDVEFLAPFKFYRDEPRSIFVHAIFEKPGDEIVAHCALVGERALANQEVPQRTVHFTGRVRLAATAPSLESTPVPTVAAKAAAPEQIYRVYFHGPAYQVLDVAWGTKDGAAGRLAADLPPSHVPEGRATATHPRLAELAFQAAGIWEIGTAGTMALPRHVDRVVFSGDPERAAGNVTAVVSPVNGGFDARVADDSGATFLVMEGYRTVPLPAHLSEEAIAPLRRAIAEID